jgi:ferritin-like metal-binding protein YciE
MAEQIKTMHEAFLHELGDTYDAEQQLTKALPELLKKAEHPKVKQGIEQHLKETEQQVKNLEQVFQSLGAKPRKVTCKGMAGIVAENKSTLEEIKEKALIDGAIVGGSGKVEHYEIASYRCLVSKAMLMGHTEAAQLLRQNLQQEERMAQQLEELERQLGQEVIRMGPAVVGHETMGHSA